MATIVGARLAWFLLTFSALLPGVKAKTLDTDLIGVIVAAVCVTVLIVVVVIFIAYCCFRRIESKKKAALVRKDSGSVSTNGIGARWPPSMVPAGMPAGMPMYNVPVEPMLYAVPASHYYLGHYAPRFLDAEAIEYMRQQEAHSQKMGEEREEQHVTSSEHVRREEQEVTVQEETPGVVRVEPTMSQPNGHVVQDFAASSVNYRVIRKQHKHEKMPEWLRKSYDENEQSIDLEDEGSMTSSVHSSSQLVIPSTPEQAVRTQVSAHNSVLDSEQILQVPQGFTVVDYIDPEGQERSSCIVNKDEDHQVTTTTDVSNSNVTTTTTTTVVETTTTYRSQDEVVDARQASEGVQVLPASTSTPRVRSAPGIEVYEEVSMEDDGMGHNRMRQPGQGSLTDLPQAVAETEVLF